MKLLDIFGWTLVALLYAVSVICALWLGKFYRHRHFDFVSCRQPKATFLCDTLLIILLSIERPLVTIWSQMEWHRPHHYRVITQVLWFLLAGGAAYCLLYRAYVIWFEINRQLGLQDRDWRKLINSKDSNWFLEPKNRKKYGNYPRIAMLLSVMVIISAVPTSTIWCLYPDDKSMETPTRVADACIILIPVIGCFFLYRRTPILNDAFYIQKELRLILRIGFGVFLLQSGLALGLRPSKGTWQYLAFLLPTTMLAVASVYISTQRVIHKCSKYKFAKYAQGQSTMHKVDTMIGNSEFSQYPSDTNLKKDELSGEQIDMRDVLQDSAGFEAFMRHLTKEWSGENLLFLTETVQFQQELQRMLSAAQRLDSHTKAQILAIIEDESSDNAIFDCALRLPTCVPASDIVFCDVEENGDFKSDFHQKAKMLYEKYIDNQAPFQVNVSFKMQEKLRKKIYETEGQRLQNIALVNLFRPPQEEIWLMMSGSFHRFRKCVNYKKLSKRLIAAKLQRKRNQSSLMRKDTLSVNANTLTDTLARAIKQTISKASITGKFRNKGASLPSQRQNSHTCRNTAETVHDTIDSRNAKLSLSPSFAPDQSRSCSSIILEGDGVRIQH